MITRRLLSRFGHPDSEVIQRGHPDSFDHPDSEVIHSSVIPINSVIPISSVIPIISWEHSPMRGARA
jgi:hypothetical protein